MNTAKKYYYCILIFPQIALLSNNTIVIDIRFELKSLDVCHH